mgnify:CR=1 FL=1
MRINSETFKNILCKANRISPDALIKFQGRVWHSSREESDFEWENFSEIKKIVIEFDDDKINPKDTITVVVK